MSCKSLDKTGARLIYLVRVWSKAMLLVGWGLLLVGQGACTDPRQEARRQLEQRQVDFTPENFLLQVQQGDPEIVTLFLSAGMSPQVTNKIGATPLLVAARFGRLQVAELLLQKGADPNAKDQQLGGTPLIAAAINGDPALINLLLAHGADPKIRAERNGMTALMAAAMAGQAKAVEFLLDKAGGLDETDNSGRTPLIWAAYYGAVEAARLLVERGAALNPKEKDQGMTALLWAAARGHAEIVRMLLDRGADPQAADKRGKTALMWAAQNRREAVIPLLLAAGVDANLKDQEGYTALDWARAAKESRAAQLIEKAGGRASGQPLPQVPASRSQKPTPPGKDLAGPKARPASPGNHSPEKAP